MRKLNLKNTQALPGDKAVSASSFFIAAGKGFCFFERGNMNNNLNKLRTVGAIIKSLERFPKDYKIITYAKGTVWDGRILSIRQDKYEKKRDKNIIMIETT